MGRGLKAGKETVGEARNAAQHHTVPRTDPTTFLEHSGPTVRGLRNPGTGRPVRSGSDRTAEEAKSQSRTSHVGWIKFGFLSMP